MFHALCFLTVGFSEIQEDTVKLFLIMLYFSMSRGTEFGAARGRWQVTHGH